ncbi:hypothetical protein E1B28_001431 [Marasmius oreades]|uniref:Uncharacterized protein n=1 Tax=Marasmius oreades TaxID=181124 RepID=A0A9P7V3H1_9AGAR|nr:uncharacterized protein E1B28_001431 [Marasmius oreades]KAG7099601.1 hypothetical protein E1B28_001431 [Marasmius oreades]
MRSDRALPTTPVEPSRELFDRGVSRTPVTSVIQNSSITNIQIVHIVLETLAGQQIESPIPFTIMTLSSYLLPYATRTSKVRPWLMRASFYTFFPPFRRVILL